MHSRLKSLSEVLKPVRESSLHNFQGLLHTRYHLVLVLRSVQRGAISFQPRQAQGPGCAGGNFRCIQIDNERLYIIGMLSE
jgi:hypothetical protein